jgi:hypothetical protein
VPCTTEEGLPAAALWKLELPSPRTLKIQIHKLFPLNIRKRGLNTRTVLLRSWWAWLVFSDIAQSLGQHTADESLPMSRQLIVVMNPLTDSSPKYPCGTVQKSATRLHKSSTGAHTLIMGGLGHTHLLKHGILRVIWICDAL